MCSTIAHSNNFFVKVFWVWLVFGGFLRGVWGGCMFYRSALWGECWGQDQTRQAQTWLSALTDQRHGLSSLSRNLSEQLLSSVVIRLVHLSVHEYSPPGRHHQRRLTLFNCWTSYTDIKTNIFTLFCRDHVIYTQNRNTDNGKPFMTSKPLKQLYINQVRLDRIHHRQTALD